MSTAAQMREAIAEGGAGLASLPEPVLPLALTLRELAKGKEH